MLTKMWGVRPAVSALPSVTAVTNNMFRQSELPYNVMRLMSHTPPHKVAFSTSRYNNSTTSLTQKQGEAVNILEYMLGQTMVTGLPGLFALDFDGTTGHTKYAIYMSKKATYTKITGKKASFCENTAVHMVDGVPEQEFKKHYGEQWSIALETFEEEMNIHYPVKARFMPGMPHFLEAVSILNDAGLVKTAIVSYMSHGRLTEAAKNLNLWRYVDAVEGTKDEGQDKTTPEMFTERIYPNLFKYGPAPSNVVCIGDSRTTDRLTAESVPEGRGNFIAYGKGKCGVSETEEMTYPHIPDWYRGTDMLIEAARKAIKQSGASNIAMTQSAVERLEQEFSLLEQEKAGRCI